MTYAHHFKYIDEISVKAWRNIVRDLKMLSANLPMHSETAGGHFQNFPVKLRREPDIEGEPEFNWKAVQFNGVSDLGRDPFRLSRLKTKNYNDWVTCNTEGLPYDHMVCAALIIIEFHAPGCLEIATDGSREHWLPALTHAQEVLASPGMRLPPCLRLSNEEWALYDAPAWF